MLSILLKCPLFRGISVSLMKEHTAFICKDKHAYAKGAVAYDAYGHKPVMMILIKGRAKVEQFHEDGSYTFLKRLFPSDVFGVLALFNSHNTYPTRVVFDKESQVIQLNEGALLSLFQKEPQILKNYLCFFNDQIQYLLERISLFSIQNARDRVFRYIVTLNTKQNGYLPYSKVELAHYLGIGRSTLYRILDKLEKEGHVQITKNRLLLKKP